MLIIKERIIVNKWSESCRKQHLSIGFVPTMGALHEGHISLIRRARELCDVVICSIFVNPTQFNDSADFALYPVTTENDIEMLTVAGADCLFMPTTDDVYNTDTSWPDKYQLGALEAILEGPFRPGHFQGVCKVVHRLLAYVKPDILLLGRKDFQQCIVVQKLIDDFSLPVQLEIVSTLRESNGLAMSSRNMRLSDEQKIQAGVIFQALKELKKRIRPGSLAHLKQTAKEMLVQAGLQPDYVEIVFADNFTIAEEWDGHQKLVALIAAFLDKVRLIDNAEIS